MIVQKFLILRSGSVSCEGPGFLCLFLGICFYLALSGYRVQILFNLVSNSMKVSFNVCIWSSFFELVVIYEHVQSIFLFFELFVEGRALPTIRSCLLHQLP